MLACGADPVGAVVAAPDASARMTLVLPQVYVELVEDERERGKITQRLLNTITMESVELPSDKVSIVSVIALRRYIRVCLVAFRVRVLASVMCGPWECVRMRSEFP